MRCGKRDIIRLWISVNFAGVKKSKSIPTKSLIDRCENVINFEVVFKNAIKRDSSFNVYRLLHSRKVSMKILICSDLTLGLLTQILIKRLRADLGLDTNITKNRLICFRKFTIFFLNISKFFSKYLKNISLHFINITVKTPKHISLSANLRKLCSCAAYNKPLNNFT